MNERMMAAALRQVIAGLTEAVAVLEGEVPGPERDHRRLELMKRFDVPASEGLSREEASQAFKECGYLPRSFGGWVRRGWITRDGDRRYLTDRGRAWIAEQESAARS
jgi:hypothetical protein